MDILIWIIASTLLVSLISFVGVFTLSLKGKLLNKILLILVSFAAGSLIGGAFFHLLPEALEISFSPNIFLYLVFGIFAFFLLEKILHWRHCHKEKCDIHPFTYLNLVGDGVHNFIDGLIIAASFLVNIELGIITTTAVILHEIPQEIGDFAILIYGGFSRLKALFFNFLSAITAVAGALVGYFLASYFTNLTIFLLPFAAGGFIYIASSDLIPELHKERDLKKSFLNLVFFGIGIAFMWFLV